MQKSMLTAAFCVLALAACERHLDTSKSEAAVKLAAAGTAGNLVGISPAPATTMHASNVADGSQPLTETPGTTAVSDQEKELTKAEESKAMPLPGQPNDHSNSAPDASQKAGKSDPQQEPGRKSE
jgi:hypothetical protein